MRRTGVWLCQTAQHKMAQSQHLVVSLLASAATVSAHAGNIVREILNRGNLGVVEKGKNDPQTEADRRAQEYICSTLAQKFPGVKIIGEEDGEFQPDKLNIIAPDPDPAILALSCPPEFKDVKEDEVTVWVDPLDGTTEFTQGILEAVTVLIGVSVGDKPVAGVIHQPFSPDRKTFWGLIGAGVGGFTPKAPEPNKKIVVTTRSHSNKIVQSALDALKPDEVLRVGGAGHKVVLLLEGKANAYVFASAGCKKWDTCAPEAILTTLGGHLTDVHGKKYQYHKNVAKLNAAGVIATAPGEDHSAWLKKLPEDVTKAFV